MYKYVKYCLKIKNCCLKTRTKHRRYVIFSFLLCRDYYYFFPHFWFSESQPTSPTDVSWMTVTCSEKISKSWSESEK